MTSKTSSTVPAGDAVKFSPSLLIGDATAVALQALDAEVKIPARVLAKVKDLPEGVKVGKFGKVTTWRTFAPTLKHADLTDDDTGETITDAEGNPLRVNWEANRYSVTIDAPRDEEGHPLSPVGQACTFDAWQTVDAFLASVPRYREDSEGKRTRLADAAYASVNITRPNGDVLAMDVLVTPVAQGEAWRIAAMLK